MAAANPTILEDETTCSICLEFFQEPVIIHCGHSFCRACITDYWKQSDVDVCCPMCRICSPEKHLIPNRHLQNIVKNYKELCLQSKSPPKESLCSEHKKALSLYCENDASLICLACEKSEAHKGHIVVCAGDADKDLKNTGSNLERCKTKTSGTRKRLKKFSEESTSVQHTPKKRRENVPPAPQKRYRAATTVCGGGPVDTVASACASMVDAYEGMVDTFAGMADTFAGMVNAFWAN